MGECEREREVAQMPPTRIINRINIILHILLKRTVLGEREGKRKNKKQKTKETKLFVGGGGGVGDRRERGRK